jgi:hypothetical protein
MQKRSRKRVCACVREIEKESERERERENERENENKREHAPAHLMSMYRIQSGVRNRMIRKLSELVIKNNILLRLLFCLYTNSSRRINVIYYFF